MTKRLKRTNVLFACLLFTAFLFTSCEKAVQEPAAAQLDRVFTVLTKDLLLQTYNANNLGSPLKSVQVTGLQSAETVLGIDYRPATGQLYALGNTSRIYMINQNNGVATAVGSGPFTPALAGIVGGFDFNPVVDRIRIVTSTGQNLRVNPETGAVVSVDASINGAPGAQISGSAYSDSHPVTNATTLYDIDVVAKKLYKQDPPNNGTLVEVGSLTISNASGEAGFDISYDGVALAAVSNGGASSLYQIDLATGTSTSLGNFTDRILGLAIPTEAVGYAVDALSNTILAFGLNGGGSFPLFVTNLQAGESLLGIDFRPANGQLYALGSTSRLYTINVGTAVATQVGTSQFTTLLSGTTFGFDFNPVADRIRIVSNTGQNLRIDPNTGMVAAVDASLNPGTPTVSAAAYTNNFTGATSTFLYDIDYTTNHLYRQDPPNNGVLVDIGPLGIDIEASGEFDIAGTSGTAYALLPVGSRSFLYTINLTTGTATLIGGLPGPFQNFKGLAIGLGF